MNTFLKLSKITLHLTFVIILFFFSTLQAKNFNKFNNGIDIANYFSGVLLLNDSKYNESHKFLKKLDGLEESHPAFSAKYLYTLINSGNFNQAVRYSKKLERENKESFESDLIIGTYYLKNSKLSIASKYFLKAKNRKSKTILESYVASFLYIWSSLDNFNLEENLLNLEQLDSRFDNLKKIQGVFLNCYFDNKNTDILFENLISSKETDFSRYNYFYAKYLYSNGADDKAKTIIKNALIRYPRNLILNQFKVDLDNSSQTFEFECKNRKHVIAEMFYIAANALSSQSIYQLSNFYLNLSKFLNDKFYAFDALIAENFFKIDDLERAKKIYTRLGNYGRAFRWYSHKQISRILVTEGNKDDSLKLMKTTFYELSNAGLYETFDYAEFLKNNEEFEESIKYYTIILNKIKKNHPLFPEATDSRGVSYERIGNWDKAERDLLASLDASPDQAYVINYLAYSWIEQGIKIEESLSMLQKANKLKSNDPYIIDSLGWALFKLERYKESKDYLQLAVRLMPADPIVNDHYGDVLWKNGKEIQARYYWNYVLKLEKAEKDLKDKIEQKLIKGL